MTHPNRRAEQVEIAARRERVAALLLAGVRNQTKIAEQVGVDRSTVSRDIKAIEAEWRESAQQDIAAARGEDLRRLDRIIQALWPQVIKGDTASVNQAMGALDRRAKLLGLNAPEKREIGGPDGGPIPITAIEVVLDDEVVD